MAASPQSIANSQNPSAPLAGSEISTPLLNGISAALILPAYVALFVATGVAGYVLAYHMDTTAFSATYALALILALVSTFVSNHGDEGLRFLARTLRFVTVPVLLVITALSNPTVFFARDWIADANTVVAGYLSLVVVITILLIGLRVEGRPVPVSAPLVGTLSLFGLLNLVIVDTIVQVGFLVFVAAALFLIGYERMLLNWLARRTAPAYAGGVRDESHSETHIHRAGRQFFGAIAVWFTIFVLGALLAYQPLYALLPGIMPMNIGRLSQSGQAQVDWTKSPPQMEVRGGTHSLSDRPVAKVTMLKGESPGLWRGRVYRHYIASSWKDDQPEKDDFGVEKHFVQARIDSDKMAPIPLMENMHSLDQRYGKRMESVARFQPLFPTLTLYSPGRPLAMQATWRDVIINRYSGALNTVAYQITYSDSSYMVAGESVQLQGAAGEAPGLSEAELSRWRADEKTAPLLDLGDDPRTAEALKRIVQQITAEAQARGEKLDTPVQRMRAIDDFLHRTCVYSLSAPLTPSNEDGVVHFLNESREGACDMFASSMTLLLRAMDVPARLVTGYLQPDPSEGGSEREFTLRERDAHAWVEFYAPKLGWVAHDPSAGTRLADDSWVSQIVQRLSRFLSGSNMSVILPVLGALLLAAGLFWPQIEKRLSRTPLSGSPDDQQRLRVESTYAQAATLLKRHAKHHLPDRALTAQELDDFLSHAPLPEAARQEFAALTYLRNAARYGALPPQASDAELKASLERLKRALK
jgi:transglutaminase-like putative cysteine protease